MSLASDGIWPQEWGISKLAKRIGCVWKKQGLMGWVYDITDWIPCEVCNKQAVILPYRGKRYQVRKTEYNRKPNGSMQECHTRYGDCEASQGVATPLNPSSKSMQLTRIETFKYVGSVHLLPHISITYDSL